jgi:hypothetical protein
MGWGIGEQSGKLTRAESLTRQEPKGCPELPTMEEEDAVNQVRGAFDDV